MKYKLWFLRILMGTGIVLVIAQEGILWAESGAPAFHPKALVVLLSLLTALAATFYSKLNSPGRARLQGLRQSESALFRAVTLGYSDPKAARQRMDLLLEQARHFPGEADACYVLEWDGQRRARPTEDEVCACLRALVQGAVEYLTLTAPAPQGGVDFLQAARSGQREAPVELQAGLRSAGTRSCAAAP